MWEFLSRKRFSLTRVLTDIRYFTTQFYVIFFLDASSPRVFEVSEGDLGMLFALHLTYPSLAN